MACQSSEWTSARDQRVKSSLCADGRIEGWPERLAEDGKNILSSHWPDLGSTEVLGDKGGRGTFVHCEHCEFLSTSQANIYSLLLLCGVRFVF